MEQIQIADFLIGLAMWFARVHRVGGKMSRPYTTAFPGKAPLQIESLGNKS
jgi:hypothetical protein